MKKSLMDSLYELIEDWKIKEGAYYNEIGTAVGDCARELENLIVLHTIGLISQHDKDIEDV